MCLRHTMKSGSVPSIVTMFKMAMVLPLYVVKLRCRSSETIEWDMIGLSWATIRWCSDYSCSSCWSIHINRRLASIRRRQPSVYWLFVSDSLLLLHASILKPYLHLARSINKKIIIYLFQHLVFNTKSIWSGLSIRISRYPVSLGSGTTPFMLGQRRCVKPPLCGGA